MRQNQIDPHISLSVLFTRWPQTIHYFNKHHLKCVGCSISPFDTLEDAAANYGLGLDKFLGEVQEAVDGASGSNQTTH